MGGARCGLPDPVSAPVSSRPAFHILPRARLGRVPGTWASDAFSPVTLAAACPLWILIFPQSFERVALDDLEAQKFYYSESRRCSSVYDGTYLLK